MLLPNRKQPVAFRPVKTGIVDERIFQECINLPVLQIHPVKDFVLNGRFVSSRRLLVNNR